MVNLKLGDFGAELAGLDECEVEDQILLELHKNFLYYAALRDLVNIYGTKPLAQEIQKLHLDSNSIISYERTGEQDSGWVVYSLSDSSARLSQLRRSWSIWRFDSEGDCWVETSPPKSVSVKVEW